MRARRHETGQGPRASRSVGRMPDPLRARCSAYAFNALGFVSNFLPYRVIPGRDGRAPLLVKYLVFPRVVGSLPTGWRLHLHRFLRSDEGPGPHSHPWRFGVSLVLAGAYTEARVVAFDRRADPCLVTERIVRRPGRVHCVHRNTIHRVELAPGQECWTLFLSSPAASAWGFFDPSSGRYQPSGEHLTQTGAHETRAGYCAPLGLGEYLLGELVMLGLRFLARVAATTYGARASAFGGDTVSTS